MIELLGSFFVPFMVIFQAWQANAHAPGCYRNPNYPEYGNLVGECFLRGVQQCDGTDFRLGCVGQNGCSLCVTDTSICLPKPVCSGANGVCVKNLAECDRLINMRHCNGENCYCCKDGCLRSNKCKERGGYCLPKDQTHLCRGTQWNAGCTNTMNLGLIHDDDCFCCAPDTSICIEKEGCSNKEGFCLKKADWTTCEEEIDSSFCLGDDCACCRVQECKRTEECQVKGGYCFREKSNAHSGQQHVCEGREEQGLCGSSICKCCIPG